MDFFNTRAMQRNFIVKRLQSLGPLDTIDSVLQELRSTSNVSRKSSQQTEYQALKHFHRCGYTFLYWRKKLFKTEIDLIFLSPEKKHLVLVEVKSLKSLWNLPYRVSQKQRQRLERCRLLCENQFGILVELKYAYVFNDEVIVL